MAAILQNLHILLQVLTRFQPFPFKFGELAGVSYLCCERSFYTATSELTYVDLQLVGGCEQMCLLLKIIKP